MINRVIPLGFKLTKLGPFKINYTNSLNFFEVKNVHEDVMNECLSNLI